MPWPLLKWIMYTSSSSSSSSEDFSDAEDEGISKKGNDHRRDPNKQGEQNHDDHSDEDDFSYEPQEDETSNSSDYTFTINEPRRKRRRIDNKEASTIVSFKRRKRIWSKEDELELLKNFLDYRTRPRTANETTSFYDEVNPKFKDQFSKRKLAEKLARLKKKHRNVVNKMVNNNGQEFRFRNPHDRAIFDISHRIWAESPLYNVQEKNVVVDSHDVGSSKASFDEKHNNGDDEGNTDVREMIIGLARNPIPLSLSNYGGRGGEVVDEKWREQQILELEAYSKRLELVQHQVKAALDDLRSK
ncbi:probable transcription factor At5g28040 [Rosa rugosa]|uniref:probable transcription factor At5g28040 n=1 Tax=Rosa rugosa TaxID=74645 RepID=UPI002B408F01|nr:probable transcription factor At5g28040 [Rosa rugosa]